MLYNSLHLIDDKGNKISISTEYPEKKSDNGSYGLKEWSDNSLSSKEILLLLMKSIMASLSLTLIFDSIKPKVTALYIDPVLMWKNPNFSETIFATELLPVAADPSIANIIDI